MLVRGEEVVVQGAEARELEKRSTPVMVEARGGVGLRVVEREAGDERAERRVTVDEGGEKEGAMIDESVEREEEESEEDESERVRG